MATTLISSSSLVERALRFAEPTLARMPSTVMILACSIEGWKFHTFTPASNSAAYVALAGELHEALVGVRAGEEQVDLDAALHGPRQSVDDLGVGHEVRGRDPDAMLRELEQACGTACRCRCRRSPMRRARIARRWIPAWG